MPHLTPEPAPSIEAAGIVVPEAAEAAQKVAAAPASAPPAAASCGDASCTVDHSHGGHDHKGHDHKGHDHGHSHGHDHREEGCSDESHGHKGHGHGLETAAAQEHDHKGHDHGHDHKPTKPKVDFHDHAHKATEVRGLASAPARCRGVAQRSLLRALAAAPSVRRHLGAPTLPIFTQTLSLPCGAL